jgi:ubiquinone/menaquinone biosynthesis C-methylase UbiE
MTNSTISSEFRNIDTSRESGRLIRYLDSVDALPLFLGMKERSYEYLNLGEGSVVLDAGCGPGYDTIRMARMVGQSGKVTGVDLSDRMIAIARERAANLDHPLSFRVGDITRLDFPDASFDAVRIERTLQVIRHPQQAIAELVRVLRPLGRLVAMEPDWETFAFDPGQKDTLRKFLRFCCDQFPDGWTGRKLYRYFHKQGLQDITIHSEPIIVHDLATVSLILMMEKFLTNAVDQKIISQKKADEWLDAMKTADRKGEFTFAGMIFVVCGRK